MERKCFNRCKLNTLCMLVCVVTASRIDSHTDIVMYACTAPQREIESPLSKSVLGLMFNNVLPVRIAVAVFPSCLTGNLVANFTIADVF